VLAATSAQLVVCGAVALLFAIALVGTLHKRANIAPQKREKTCGLGLCFSRSAVSRVLGRYVATKTIALIVLQTCLPLSSVSCSFPNESGQVLTQDEPTNLNCLRQNSGDLEQATKRESARDSDQESTSLDLQPYLRLSEFEVGLPSLSGRSTRSFFAHYSQSLPQFDGFGPPNARAPPLQES
jgi:hypothetical protein